MSWEPAWKSLVRQLVDEGHESPYLDELRARYPVAAPSSSLERELLAEMASALGRAETKVLVKLLELECCAARFHENPSPGMADAFNAKRCEALRARRDLSIHREALHLRRDPDHEARYPIPAPLRVRAEDERD